MHQKDMRYAVSMAYMTGVKTITLFATKEQAAQHAQAMLEFKGCRVFLGEEVIQPMEEDSDDQ
jgi:hypothetical protein